MTGQDLGKGALYGAAAGGVTGAATGLMSGPVGVPSPAAGARAASGTGFSPTHNVTGLANVPGTISSGSGLVIRGGSTAGSWLSGLLKDPKFTGSAISGLGQGAFGYMASIEADEAARKEEEAKTKRISDNYAGFSNGLLQVAPATK